MFTKRDTEHLGTHCVEGWLVHTCPTCGKTLEETYRYCPEDGTPLTETAAAQTVPTPTNDTDEDFEDIKLPVVVGGRYRLLETRGGGGMARVYRGIDQTLEREVAVKVINPNLRNDTEFDARFEREAKIVSQLSDPHVVVVHDFGIDTGCGPYLVMEYLKGQSLRERLRKEGVMPMRAGMQLGGQILLALIHAHDRNIVHRDIKPDNIFILNQSGVRLHVRVLDFGIARIYHGDDGEQELQQITKPGAILGTPRYMSPEQLAGDPVDVRSDLYSAALVIYEAITGTLPTLTGKPLIEICPEVPQTFSDLLDHCLKANPDDRPATAIEVYLRLQETGKASGVLMLPPGALEKLLSDKGDAGTEATTTTYVTERSLAGKWFWWVLGGGLLLLALVVFLLLLVLNETT